MEDSEKLTALKKAYADIILNTAKEAAARIMVSERKATRFQQELASTKDEALRMLLRLKQMSDSKVNEAELTSLNQQKKIEELEAQLQEAEEIVRDLRAELRETQAELENVTKHQMHPPFDQNIEGEVAAQENFLQENSLHPYNGSIYSAPGLQFESVSVSDNGNPTVNGSNGSSKFCGSHNHANNCYIHNPDFASIVIRRKEPKLYRNGCTQRIHAFERSHFGGNMSVSGNKDNVQDETLVNGCEEGKAVTVSTDAKADIICDKEKPDEFKVLKADVDLVKAPVRRNTRRLRRRKFIESQLHSNKVKETKKESYLSCAKDSPVVLDNNDPSRVLKADEFRVLKADVDLVKAPVHRNTRRLRRRKFESIFHSNKVKETKKESYPSCAKDSPLVLDNDDPSRVSSSIACENEPQKQLMSPLADVPTDTAAADKQSGSHSNTEIGEVFLKVCSAWIKTKDHKETLDKSDLTRQESLSTESLEVPACKDVKACNGSVDKVEPKLSDLDEKVSDRSASDKFLKYTFSRKRKKESVSCNDVDCSQDNSCSKKKCGEKQDGHVEPQKSCTMTESSRDSRRLAQVARQLISLSEKKRWQ